MFLFMHIYIFIYIYVMRQQMHVHACAYTCIYKEERVAKAWRAFYKYKRVLCSEDCPLAPRIKLLQLLVASSSFWCPGSWNLTVAQLSNLRGVQQSMLRKMLGLRSRAGEEVSEFCARYARNIRQLMHKHKLLSWDAFYHRSVFVWAAYVSRLAQSDPTRLTHQVLNYKNWDWIRVVADQNHGRQLHCRRLHTWRWEKPLYKFFEGKQESWQQVAADSDRWHQLLDEMVVWRCGHR